MFAKCEWIAPWKIRTRTLKFEFNRWINVLVAIIDDGYVRELDAIVLPSTSPCMDVAKHCELGFDLLNTFPQCD